MKRTSLRMSSSRFKESTISEIAKTDEGIVVLKKNGDIAMLPKIYDYTDEDRSLIYCMVAAMLDLDVVSAEDVKSFMETDGQSESTDILCFLFRLPDLTGERYQWDGYSMCNPDPIFNKAREIVRPFLKETSVYYYDSAYEDTTAIDLCEEIYENKGIHIISVYGEKFNACSLLCLNKLTKPDHIILYCWNPLEQTTDGLAYNCVLDVKNAETTIITYKSQHGGCQYNGIHLDTSIYLVKE